MVVSRFHDAKSHELATLIDDRSCANCRPPNRKANRIASIVTHLAAVESAELKLRLERLQGKRHE